MMKYMIPIVIIINKLNSVCFQNKPIFSRITSLNQKRTSNLTNSIPTSHSKHVASIEISNPNPQITQERTMSHTHGHQYFIIAAGVFYYVMEISIQFPSVSHIIIQRQIGWVKQYDFQIIYIYYGCHFMFRMITFRVNTIDYKSVTNSCINLMKI